MSYIRPLQPRKYSKGEAGLYAFLSAAPEGEKDFIEDYGAMKNPENYVEITCRILEQAGVAPTLDEVNKIRDRVGLEPLDKIPSKEQIEKRKEQIRKETREKIEED